VPPLLGAGITTYPPRKRSRAGPGKRVAIVGMGGLGHMAVKLAKAVGAEATVVSTNPLQADDARCRSTSCSTLRRRCKTSRPSSSSRPA
jgi:D-arabinose 1-dehydrogenase-like Zn-dependent alcohol dehydrogenase